MAKKFVPFEKLSKKQKAEINRQKRTGWQVNPVTRIVSDKTKYNRAKFKNFSTEV